MSNIFKKSYTFRLFKREPSFIDGVVSLIDISPNKLRYNQDETEKEADVNSLRTDWYAIGADLWNAIQKNGPSQSPKQAATAK